MPLAGPHPILPPHPPSLLGLPLQPKLPYLLHLLHAWLAGCFCGHCSFCTLICLCPLHQHGLRPFGHNLLAAECLEFSHPLLHCTRYVALVQWVCKTEIHTMYVGVAHFVPQQLTQGTRWLALLPTILISSLVGRLQICMGTVQLLAGY